MTVKIDKIDDVPKKRPSRLRQNTQGPDTMKKRLREQETQYNNTDFSIREKANLPGHRCRGRRKTPPLIARGKETKNTK